MREYRQCIEVGGRLVHYRSWGEGPVVLALHGSPQSSRAVAGLATQIAAAGFRVIVPDTPGNGLSQALPGAEQAGTAVYAQALHEWVEALELERFGLYGFHTGAAVACTYAALYPERVSALLCDGLPGWSQADREALEGYLPTFEPEWDGSHMAWLWSRVEEQTIFFPWHRALSDYRMTYDVAPTQHCHGNVMDMLLAGNHYMAPYRAALVFAADAWLPRATCPKICAAHCDDPLHLQIPGLSCDDSEKAIYDSPGALLAMTLELFKQHPGSESYRSPEATSCHQGFSDTELGRLAWRQRQVGAGQPLLFIHDAGDSSLTYEQLMQTLPAHTIAIDLPGHGHSDAVDENFNIDAIARAVDSTCQQLGLRDYRVIGEGVGAHVASSLLEQGRASKVLAINPDIDPQVAAAPNGEVLSLEPEWDGAHLVCAWRIARWEQLFSPWNRRQREHAIRIPGGLDGAVVQTRAASLLQAGRQWQLALQAAAGRPQLTSGSGSTGLEIAFSGTQRTEVPGALTLPADRRDWTRALSRI